MWPVADPNDSGRWSLAATGSTGGGQRGFAWISGLVVPTSATAEYTSASTPIASALRRVLSPERRLESGMWIHDLLRGRCADHPLKWMLLWVALHATSRVDQIIGGFLSPATELVSWDIDGQGSLWASTRDALAVQIGSYFAKSVDLKSLARELRLSTCALRRHLSASGIDAHGVELKLHWERRRRQWVQAVRDFILAHPGCSRTDVHRACKAAVTWLAREAPVELRRELEIVPERRGRQVALDL